MKMASIFDTLVYCVARLRGTTPPTTPVDVTMASEGAMRNALNHLGLGFGAHYCAHCKTDAGPHQVEVGRLRAKITHRCGRSWHIIEPMTEGKEHAKRGHGYATA